MNSPTKKILTYNVLTRYSKLNEESKKNVRNKFCEQFFVKKAQFYNRVKSNRLNGEELLFFSSVFEVSVNELYEE